MFSVSKLCKFILISLIFLNGCDKKNQKNDQNSTTTGNVNISITSIVAGSSPHLFSTGCSVSEGAAVGSCYTPISMSGVFNTASITNFAGGNTARLMGGGDKYHGLDDIFRQAKFDLSQKLFMDGDDNLQDQGTVTYSGISVDTKALELVFTSMSKYFHVRYSFVDQPPSSSSIFSTCGLDSGTSEQADLKGTIWTAPSNIKAGDILVCLKDTSTETCTDSEYQWISSDTGALTSTRPTSPVRFSGSYAFEASKCISTGERPDITWGGVSLYAQLDTSVEIGATIDQGKKLYSSGSSTGHTMDLTLTIDTTDSLFVPSQLISAFNSSDYNTDGPTILKNLDKITLRQIYEYNNRISSSVMISGNSMLNSQLSITLSEKDEASDGDDQDNL